MRYEIAHNGDHWILMQVTDQDVPGTFEGSRAFLPQPVYKAIFKGRYYECEKLKRELEEQQKLKSQ